MNSTSTGPDGGKQKLSPAARRAKQARDKTAAMTSDRKDKKAENQRIGQSSKYDLHHASSGRVTKTSRRYNRNVWQRNERA